MSKERKGKKSIVHLKVCELKDLIEKTLQSTNKESFIYEIKETLEKLNDSIIELNEDDLRNLILSVAISHSSIEESIKKTNPIEFNLITRTEMAEELQISLPTLRKWTVKKIIPNHIKLGGFVYYNKQQVFDFLNK